MLGALVQVQTGQSVLAQGVLGQHALDGQLNGVVGAGSHHVAGLGLLQTADPAGHTVVLLLLGLLAGQNSLVGVDDDDVIAAVNVGGEVDLVLAAKQVSGGNSGTAQGLTGSVDHIPLALQGLLFQQSSGHYDFLQFGLKYFDILRCLKYNAFRTLELYTTLKIKCQQHF